MSESDTEGGKKNPSTFLKNQIKHQQKDQNQDNLPINENPRQFIIEDINDQQQLSQISQAQQSQEQTIHQNQLNLEIKPEDQNIEQQNQKNQECNIQNCVDEIDEKNDFKNKVKNPFQIDKQQKKIRKKRSKNFNLKQETINFPMQQLQKRKKRDKKKINNSSSQFNFQKQLKDQTKNQQNYNEFQNSQKDQDLSDQERKEQQRKKRQKNNVILQTQEEFLIQEGDIDKFDQFDWDQIQNSKNVQLQKSQANLIDQSRKRRVHPKNSNQDKELYLEENQEKVNFNQQESKSLLDRILYYKMYVALVALILIVLGVAMGLVYKYFLSESPSSNNLKKIALAVNRSFRANTVYKYDYSFDAEVQNQSLNSNYTCIFAVQQVDQTYINFFGIALKNSQTSGNNTVLYTPPQLYQKILKGQIQNMLPFTFQDLINNSNSTNFTMQFSNGTYKDVNFYHPVFKFSVTYYGTLENITFPSNMQPSNVHFLTTFIKMFIPNIDLSLYQQQGNARRVLQNQNSSQNSSNQEYYNLSKKESGQTLLQKQSSMKNSTQQQNSEESGTQSSNFDQNNELQSSQMSSNMQLSSLTRQPSNDTIMQNFDFSLTIDQTATMQIFQKYNTNETCIQALQLFLINFQTLTLKSDEIEDWIRQDHSVNGSRNLQKVGGDSDSQLVLYQYEKTIIQTDVIGYKVSGGAYFQISIKDKSNQTDQDVLYNYGQQIQNSSLSQTWSQFEAAIGLKLTLGRNKYKYPIFGISKKLPPLQIAYTLGIVKQSLQEALPPFFSDIDSLWTAFSTCKDYFEGLVSEISYNINPLVQQIITSLRQQQDLASPTSIINQVKAQTVTLHQTMLNEFSNLFLNLKTQQQNLTSLIYAFTNSSFQSQLLKFLNAKSQFLNIRSRGSSFLIEQCTNFTGIDQGNSTNEINEILLQAADDYDSKILTQMIPIFVYLDNIYNRTLEYRLELQSIQVQHYQNFINFCHGMIDYYFVNQSTTLKPYLNESEYQVQMITEDLANWTNFSSLKVEQIENASMAMFRQFLAQMRINSTQSSFYVDLNSSLQASKNNILSFATQNSVDNSNIQFMSWLNGGLGSLQFNFYNLNSELLGQYNRVNTVLNDLNPFLIQVINALESFTSEFQNKLSGSNYSVQSTVQWLAGYQFSSNLMTNVYFGTENLTKYQCTLQSLVQKTFQTFTSVTRSVTAGQQTRYFVNGNSLPLKSQLAEFQNYTDWVSQTLDRFLNYQIRLLSFFQKMDLALYINLKYQIFAIQDYVYMNGDIFRTSDRNIIQASDELNTISLTYDAQKIFQNQLEDNISQLIFVFPINKRSFCQSQQLFENMTTQIRSQIHTRYMNITDLISLNRSIYFLTYDELVQAQSFFYQRSIDFLEVIFSNITCSQIAPLDIDVNNLYVLRTKLLYLKDLQVQFYRIWNESSARVQKQESITHEFNYTLFQLRSKVEFQAFFYDVGLLRYTMKNNVLTISTDMTNYKTYLKNIYNLGSDLASIQQYDAAIYRFQISNFTFSSNLMYSQSYQLQKLAIQAYQKLNYEIICAYVTAKKVHRFYNGGLSNYSFNLNSFNMSFIQMTTDFLNTNINTTQQIFTDLVQRFDDLKNNLNKLLPTKLYNEQKVILTPLYNLTQVKYRQFYNRALTVLYNFVKVIQTDNQQTIQGMSVYIKQAHDLIDGLNIGELNVLKAIAKVGSDTVLNYSSFFLNTTDKVLNFIDIITADSCKIVSFQNYYNSINRTLNQQFLNSFTNTSTNMTNLIKILQLKQDYFNKITAQTFYPKLLKFIKKDYKNYAISSRETSVQVIKILNLINSIDPSVFELYTTLNDIIQKLQPIPSASLRRIQSVRSFYPNIKQNYFNLRNLIFKNIQTVSKAHKEDIDKQVLLLDHILNLDLFNITQVQVGVLKNQTIKNQVIIDNLRNIAFMVSTLQDKYKNFTANKKSLDNSFFSYINSVMQFSIRTSSKTVYILLNSRSRLMSQPPDKDKLSQSVTLYQQDLIDPYQKQLISFRYTVMTTIGPINFKIALTFKFDIYGAIKLIQYRDINIGVTFDASINLYTEVSFGIPNILVVGVFIEGSIFQVKITPSISFDNFLPLTSIKPLNQIQSVNNQNVLQVNFLVDIEFLACSFTIGVFIQHIWFRFKMAKVCIFGWCFMFPVGIELYMRREQFSHTFPGILIARFEFKINVFKFQYLA